MNWKNFLISIFAPIISIVFILSIKWVVTNSWESVIYIAIGGVFVLTSAAIYSILENW